MRSFIQKLRPRPKSWAKALLSSADDPRELFVEADQRQQDLLIRVREAQTKISVSKRQLEAKANDARSRLPKFKEQADQARLAGREDLARLILQLVEVTEEETSTLERQVKELEQEEQVLALIEQRLMAQIEAIAARQEVIAARHSTAEVHAHIDEALDGVSEDLAGLGQALEQAEQRTEEMEAKVSAIDSLIRLSMPGMQRQVAKDVGARRLSALYISEMRAKQPESRKQHLDQGLKTLERLVSEYEQLRPLLQKKDEMDPHSVAYIPPLVEETFRQGLNVLQSARELILVTYAPNRNALEVDTVELTEELEFLREEGANSKRIGFLEERINSHKERLEILKLQESRVEDLLHEAARCEASLHRVRIELTALKAGNSEMRVEEVTETLRKTITHAKEVQEELRRLGI